MEVTYFSLTILALALTLQLATPKKIKPLAKWVFIVSVGLVFTYWSYLTYAQYLAWGGSGSLSVYLVPPYRSLLYVINYHFIRFGLYYLISLVAAAVFFVAAQKLNKRFNGRFFEPEEPYLGALSLFLLGNSAWGYAWIFYIVAMLSIAAIVTGYQLLVTKENCRFSLYWLWLPVAILIIIVMNLF